MTLGPVLEQVDHWERVARDKAAQGAREPEDRSAATVGRLETLKWYHRGFETLLKVLGYLDRDMKRGQRLRENVSFPGGTGIA